MKVAVVGSRTLSQAYYARLSENVPAGCSEIISGGASGIDALAEQYAVKEGLKLTVIAPDYEKHHKSAPLFRNAQIVEQADYVLALWDGKSKGTLNIIMTCLTQHKPIRLVLVKPDLL